MAGELVAESVRDPGPVDLLHRLDHVRVVADDQVDPGVPGDGAGQFPLRAAGVALVLAAPVDGEDHHLGAGRAGPLLGGGDGLDADEVGQPGLVPGDLVAVEAGGEGELGDLDALDVQDVRPVRLLLAAGGPGVPEALAVQGVEGALDPLGAVVEGVVGGRGAGVVADVLDRLGDLRRDEEVGVGLEGAAGLAEDRLQVADPEVGLADDGLDARHDAVEVVSRVSGRACVPGGLVGELGVDQDVSGRGDREGPAAPAAGRRGAAAGPAEQAAPREGEAQRRAQERGEGPGGDRSGGAGMHSVIFGQ